MNKRLIALFASIGLLAGLAPAANAAVGTANFNVTATLTSACTMAAFSGPLAFGTVTAFVAPAAPTAVTSTVTCTRTLTGVTAVFDTTNGTASAAGTSPTGDGVLDNGLNYSLAGTLGTISGGTAATSASGGIGTGATGTFTVNGSMAAQAGSCSTGSCVATPQVRTVTLNF